MRRLLLPPVAWLAGIVGMLLLHEYAPFGHIEPEAWRTATGITLAAVGFGATLWHARQFSKLRTNINTFKEPDKLVEVGLFRRIRNPMYLGFLISLVGLAATLGAVSAWFVVVAFFLLADRWYIPFEERAMQQRFGDEYQRYVSRTRRWL